MTGRPPAHEVTTVRAGDRPLTGSGGLVLRVFGHGVFAAFPLPSSGTVVIGRSERCDVAIDDASLSRRHAALHLEEGVSLEDLASSNGTRIGGTTLRPNVRHPVPHGALLELGSVLLVVQTTAAQPSDDVAIETEPYDALIDRIAAGAISVLVLGETGVGKERMAERIHLASPRREKPLLRLNCGGFTEALLESELFGHERGAFTGAVASKPGLLETANGGTVFLDEVGELPPSLQAKLLRVLEDRHVRRVGALKSHAIDVRFVSATNRDLEAESAAGRFRTDLYFRLAGATVSIPPLRERPHEIERLARAFLEQSAGPSGRPKELAPAALAALRAHAWPGNIRELRNVIERAALVADGGVIEPAHLVLTRTAKVPSEAATAETHTSPPAAAAAATPAAAASLPLEREIQELEKRRILDALAACAGSQTRAAELLGIPRGTLLVRLDQYGIPRPRKKR